ncbi:unnamed protein product [Cylicocyclus nassatus]|uniref:Uncharacterized protein n=1 Tax=Cylicocyclus nassatus TaxID=53992 RepID=A0AA36MDM9_CYLNA|nr:unnamed protein product [Cylicocyclus nassatus]
MKRCPYSQKKLCAYWKASDGGIEHIIASRAADLRNDKWKSRETVTYHEFSFSCFPAYIKKITRINLVFCFYWSGHQSNSHQRKNSGSSHLFSRKLHLIVDRHRLV